MANPRKRIAVLISGRGSNMNSLIAATMDPAYPARICLVLSNKRQAGGLKIAEDHGIETNAIANRDFDSREAHEAAVHEALLEAEPDLICLAGYMRIFSEDFTNKWAGKILNIHPSLLPLFHGLDTHARALESGARIHGCTVHFVNAGLDEGPIVAQAAVPILVNDTEESLQERVLAAEHLLYPQALEMVASGAARESGGRVVFSGDYATKEGHYLIAPLLR